ncbi:hypothetical protein BH23CHL4_BH23CHL4_28720 [soil metagenome]
MARPGLFGGWHITSFPTRNRHGIRRLHDCRVAAERRGDAPPSTANRQRLLQIREIIDVGRIVYTDEGLQLFLTAPMPVFDVSTALQMIERGEGERVFAALA